MISPATVLRSGLLVVLLAGCGRETSSLSGTVRYDGKPLEAGFVTVFPTSGEGASKGAEIQGGQFQLEGLPPGSARVLVTTPPKYAPDSTAKSGLKALPQTMVSPNAEGNRRVIELRPGAQTIDF